MTKVRNTIRRLAEEANLDAEEAILLLMERGFDFEDLDEVLTRSALRKVRHALSLPSSAADSRNVSELARMADLTEADARRRLVKAGVLRKKQIKRVPKSLLPRAQVALGLRVPKPPVSEPALEDAEPLEAPQVKEKKRPKQGLQGLVWKIIGRPEPLVYLSPGDVNSIHWIVVRDFRKTRDPVSPPGIRDVNIFESAVYRAKTSWQGGDKYPTVAMAGAALLHSLVLNHPFHNGNKRTALVSLVVFLDKNGYLLKLDQDELYEFVLALADHKLADRRTGRPAETSDEELMCIARWLQAYMRQVRKGEYPLQFRQLRTILGEYGCSFDVAKGMGNRINITRKGYQTQVFYRNEGAEVHANSIHKIRRDLALDEEHGYDSDIFYNTSPRIPEFILKYRRVLERLAKV